MTISLDLSPEQTQIVDAARSVLTDHFSPSRLTAGHAASDASRLLHIAEVGGFGLGAPERVGGAGCTILEEILLSIELGRHLVSPNALGAMLLARIAVATGDDALAAAVIAGTLRVAVANALSAFEGTQAAGVEIHLIDGVGADYAVLWNRRGGTVLDLSRLDRKPVAPMDRSVTLQRGLVTPAAIVCVIEDPGIALDADLMVAAQLSGMAAATRDMAVAYAGLRTQFGQKIGAFQAIKHRCANMAINAELLSAQVMFAALARRDHWDDADFHIAACRLLAPRLMLENARHGIQIHGGMGFSAECEAHLYLMRGHLYATLASTGEMNMERFLDCPPASPVRELCREGRAS